MLKPPVAHDGNGRVAAGLARWALVAAVVASVCVVPKLLLTLLQGDDHGDRAALDIGAIRRALKAYREQKGAWPPEEGWSQALVDALTLEHEPLDPWGHPYRYRLVVVDGGEPWPEVTSSGRDGVPDTEDDVAPYARRAFGP